MLSLSVIKDFNILKGILLNFCPALVNLLEN
jgi:hypothetical protein